MRKSVQIAALCVTPWGSVCRQVSVCGLATHSGGRASCGISILRCLCMLLAIACPQIAESADDENCLMCHKLRGLGVYESGNGEHPVKRLFYIDEDEYKSSYHGRVRCSGCHKGIKQIPHEEVQPVNCADECHIRDPSSDNWYSHSRIATDLEQSAHGAKNANSGDYPDCKYCHNNKPYQQNAGALEDLKGFIAICLQCHESADWTERFYKHINYRVQVRRSSQEIVALCVECHTDTAMMGRHNLDVVAAFKDTFHGKAIKYGSTEVANCLSCHAPYRLGFSPHRIMSRRERNSPVSPYNKLRTCKQSGCHTEAKEEFASSGKVHPSSYGMVSWLRPKMSTPEAQPEIFFQKEVIYFINLFYKILIAVVITGLVVHQILSLFAMRRTGRLEIRE